MTGALAACIPAIATVAGAGNRDREPAPTVQGTPTTMTAPPCIDDASNGQEREFALGQTFEICLPENPTTGYRWQLDSAAAPIVALESDRFEPPDGPPGQGGRHHWQFRATQVGAAAIELAYRRAWANDGPPAKTFTLRIRVRA